MPRTINQSIPNPDDGTNGLADAVASIQIRRDAVGQPVVIRVDYPSDPDGAFEFRVADLPGPDRVKVREAALAILAHFKTQRGYTG